MDTMTERLERLAELQKKNIEPLHQIGGNAFTAFELMARKNYELMGDMVEYAVAQSRGSMEQASPKDLYERQLNEARAFAERMSARAAEYVTLAEQIRAEMHPDGSSDDAADPTPSAGKASTKDPAPTGRDGTAGSTTATASAPDGTAKKPSTAKKSTAKKAATGKSAAKKSTAKKSAARKSTAKKSAAGKSATKKSAAKKTPASRRSTAKK